MAPDPSNPLIAYADHETRVYKTVDGGKSWSTILRVNFPKTTLDYSETNVVYVSSDNSILRSDDGGINWKTLAQGGGQITVHPVDHNIIYTVYQGSLYKSLDKGDTWSALGPTPGGHLYIIPLDPDTMYLSNDLNGLHLSTDGGATWSRVDFGGRRARRLIQTLNGDLWIADFQKGLFRSVDNGRNWALTLNVPAWRLAADPWDSESLFVVADQKVFWVHPAGTSRTIDTGGSGGQLDPPASFRTVDKCQVIERSNTVYNLVSDLSVIGEGSCLLIARFVHDVTIEGNGHTIRFAGAGVYGDSIRNLIIRNLNLVQVGVGSRGAHSAIQLSHVDGLEVDSNTVTTYERGKTGISVSGINSKNVSLTSNTIHNDGKFSVGMFVNSPKALITRNTINSPTGNGLDMKLSPNSIIVDNYISASADQGFALRIHTSPGANLAGNTFIGAGRSADGTFRFSNSDGMVVEQNTFETKSSPATGYGVLIKDSSGMRFAGNTVKHQMRQFPAISLKNSHNNLLQNNAVTCEAIGCAGILIDYSDQNQIFDNVVNVLGQDSQWGIRLQNTDRNELMLNTVNVNGRLITSTYMAALSLDNARHNYISVLGMKGSVADIELVNSSGIIVQSGRLSVDANGDVIFVLRPPDDEGKFGFAFASPVVISLERDPNDSVIALNFLQSSLQFDMPATGTINVSDSSGSIGIDTVQVGVTNVAAVLPGLTDPAQDLNGDGLAEDVNGNGRLDFNDMVKLFENMSTTTVTDNSRQFDFNGNGFVDMDDIVQLFMILVSRFG